MRSPGDKQALGYSFTLGMGVTMNSDQWLLLTDYASKYRISVSTLRRRIKTGTINFRMEAGKYFIMDAPPRGLSNSPAADANLTFPGIRPFATQAAPLDDSVHSHVEPTYDSRESEPVAETHAATPDLASDEPIISTATRLLNELKRAYMNILQEKEEQIIQLKEEVSDLKTLVRVLEEDNDRMRRHFTEVIP